MVSFILETNFSNLYKSEISVFEISLVQIVNTEICLSPHQIYAKQRNNYLINWLIVYYRTLCTQTIITEK